MDMEYLGEGLQVAGIGFTVVMVALTLLWIIVVAFSRFLAPDEYRNKDKADVSAGGTLDTAQASGRQANADDRSGHLRRVAAITAAVTATMAASGGADFRIVSIRPVRNPESDAWKFAGRKSRLQTRPRTRT